MKSEFRIFIVLLLALYLSALCLPRHTLATGTPVRISTTSSHHLDQCLTTLLRLAENGFPNSRRFVAAEAPSHRRPGFVDTTMLVVLHVTAAKPALLSATSLNRIFEMATQHGVKSLDQKIFRGEEKGKPVARIPLIGEHSYLSDVYYRLMGERPFSRDFKVTATVVRDIDDTTLAGVLATEHRSEAQEDPLEIALTDASVATHNLPSMRQFADIISRLPEGRGHLVAAQFIFHPTAILEIMDLEARFAELDARYAERVAKTLAEIASGIQSDRPITQVINIDGQRYMTATVVDQHILIMTKVGRKIVVLGFMGYQATVKSERTLAGRIPKRGSEKPIPLQTER